MHYTYNWNNRDNLKWTKLIGPVRFTKNLFSLSTNREALNSGHPRIPAKLIPRIYHPRLFTQFPNSYFRIFPAGARTKARIPAQTRSLIHETKNAIIKYPSGYSLVDPASLRERNSPLFTSTFHEFRAVTSWDQPSELLFRLMNP